MRLKHFYQFVVGEEVLDDVEGLASFESSFLDMVSLAVELASERMGTGKLVDECETTPNRQTIRNACEEHIYFRQRDMSEPIDGHDHVELSGDGFQVVGVRLLERDAIPGEVFLP